MNGHLSSDHVSGIGISPSAEVDLQQPDFRETWEDSDDTDSVTPQNAGTLKAVEDGLKGCYETLR